MGAFPHPNLGPGNGWDLGGAEEGKKRQYTPMAEGQKQPPLSVPGLLSPDSNDTVSQTILYCGNLCLTGSSALGLCSMNTSSITLPWHPKYLHFPHFIPT